MSQRFARPMFWLLLSSAIAAQSFPSGLTLVATHTVIPFIPAGIVFDPTGTTLYVGNVTGGSIQAVPVVRDPVTSQIIGFGAPVFHTAAPNVDGGIEIDASGTFLWTRWPTHAINQLAAGGATATISLAGSGVPTSTGGLTFVPPSLPTAGDVLVTSYTSGGIYKITLTPSALGNGTYDLVPGSGTLYATTPAGIEGLTHIPTGPLTGRILYANYNTSQVVLLDVDVATGAPTGTSNVIITGLVNPMDIAFDPITNDFFVSTYQSTSNLKQFRGTVIGDFQTNQPEATFTVNGQQGTILAAPRTIVASGTPVTVAWSSTLIGNPFDVFLSSVPADAGGLPTAGGQIINLDLGAPFSPAFNFFGATIAPASFPLTLPVGFYSAQLVVLDAGSPDLFRLSQPVELEVLNCTALENIDATPLGIGNYPAGWSNGGGSNQWQPLSGATSSAGTGPDADHTSGAGRYMYCETSISGTGTFIMNVGSYPVGGGENAKFWYHLYGSTIGVLVLQQETTPGVWTNLWSLSGDQGAAWHEAVVPLNTGSGTATLRLHYTWGGSFTGDAAIDDFGVCF
jgi:hypothetical protein